MWLVRGPGSAVDCVEDVLEDLGAVLDLFKLLQLPESLPAFRLSHGVLLEPRQHPGHRESESLWLVPSICEAAALFRLALIPLGSTSRRHGSRVLLTGLLSISV